MREQDDALAYPVDQLLAALLAAERASDQAQRDAADRRTKRWLSVVHGVLSGRLRIGSRTPVAGLPAWVTPEVVRGGFATGASAAGGPITDVEKAWAAQLGVPAQRRSVFEAAITPPGLALLGELLEQGRYRIQVPEEGALLTVAWLLAAGDQAGAGRVLTALWPFADQVRLVPRPAAAPVPDPTVVVSSDVYELTEWLGARWPTPQLTAMREALTVWNPFADALLELWLRAGLPDHGPAEPAADWLAEAATLLGRYRTLAQQHQACGKHRNPKENLGILVGALQEACATGRLDARRTGAVRMACAAMVGRRGAPGSDALQHLRQVQHRDGTLPLFKDIAAVLVERLAGHPQDASLADPQALLHPVTADEASTSGVPAGTPIPPNLRRAVLACRSGTIEELLELGLITSAEALAALVPRMVAQTTAQAYPDPVLQRLMAASATAFAARRSLLLVDLQHQVRFEELPWVAAVLPHRQQSATGRQDAHEALLHLTGLTVSHFPGTVLPNRWVSQARALSRVARLDVPWVEELAADIFMGTFSAKYARAATIAADLLEGSLYARYYGIDWAGVRALPQGEQAGQHFGELCRARSGAHEQPRRSVASNGTIIEQAQILTTHNLATLAGPVGFVPADGWDIVALGAFAAVLREVDQATGTSGTLRSVKNAAYAWRQMVFALSMLPAQQCRDAVGRVEAASQAHRGRAGVRLQPAVDGLRAVEAGAAFAPDGTTIWGGRRLLGWTTGPHWLGVPAVSQGV